VLRTDQNLDEMRDRWKERLNDDRGWIPEDKEREVLEKLFAMTNEDLTLLVRKYFTVEQNGRQRHVLAHEHAEVDAVREKTEPLATAPGSFSLPDETALPRVARALAHVIIQNPTEKRVHGPRSSGHANDPLYSLYFSRIFRLCRGSRARSASTRARPSSHACATASSGSAPLLGWLDEFAAALTTRLTARQTGRAPTNIV
jgi:hypothetical protein